MHTLVHGCQRSWLQRLRLVLPMQLLLLRRQRLQLQLLWRWLLLLLLLALWLLLLQPMLLLLLVLLVLLLPTLSQLAPCLPWQRAVHKRGELPNSPQNLVCSGSSIRRCHQQSKSSGCSASQRFSRCRGGSSPANHLL